MIKINIQIVILLFFTSCIRQTKYFQPTGINNKTEEFKQNKTDWIALVDKVGVDVYTRIGDSVFCGEINCNVPPVKGVDIPTFRVLAGTSYAKDKYNVYYPLQIMCNDSEDCGVCYCTKYIIQNANPATFRYLGKEYATDGINVYFRGELIKGADGVTFKVIEGPEFFYYAIDKLNVYKHDEIFLGADPNTFYYDKEDSRNIDTKQQHNYIIGDKLKEWEYIPPHSIKEIEKK